MLLGDDIGSEVDASDVDAANDESHDDALNVASKTDVFLDDALNVDLNVASNVDHSYVGHDSFIRMCAMTHSFVMHSMLT